MLDVCEHAIAHRGRQGASTARKIENRRALGAYPWVIYHQDREMVTQLFSAIRKAGAPPLRVGTEVTSLLVLIHLLRAGAYLSCMPMH